MSTGAEVFTTIHLVVIALLAIVTIVGIVGGMRLRQQRRASARLRATHQTKAEAAPTGSLDARRPIDDAPASQPPFAAAPLAAPVAGDTAPPTRAVTPAADPDSTACPDPMASEPITAAAPMDASPAAEATGTGVATPGGPAAQPVTTLKGLGPKIAVRLGELGIATVGDIAALDDASAAALDRQLGPFAGRMARDRWLEQARLLAAGDRAGFEAVFGRL